ncbi:hypothetical protein [Actimicrobium sp. CCI2.3]|uniref:hypothetical protein n=1 Tax=Actimicrobium sp. CCI2.3 TaxID=3048616 RepID=UPI002AB4D1B1|nr:hypothetical protein [Actimicrobium sp. CCI2.3]MDY7573051.1 hypothetical protein [Actimicrobium sp. CCI2.3]MEB0020849.1 hypothetical protein [Actimicrobium sp. CCI2.3]
MKSGRSLSDLAFELQRQRSAKNDIVVRSSLMMYRTNFMGVPDMDIDEKGDVRHYGVSKLARR